MSAIFKYDQRGVSADKHEVHAAIEHLDKGLYHHTFCKILPDIVGGNRDFCNLMHADTAGTKPSLAYVYWRETGDMSVWAGIVQDALVMNLDDMACSGCVNDIVINSTIGRNKHLVGGEVIAALVKGATDFIEKMRRLGIQIIHSGGETADVGDIVRTIDVGFTAFARMPRNKIIVNDIQNGDVVVGFASYGQASYETEYNSGMGSNGLTSARHDVFGQQYAAKYPESFDPKTDKELVYAGSKSLTETLRIGDEDITLGKLVLSPTRTFLPVIREILRDYRADIHGMIHNTGGGQTKVIKFLNRQRVVKNNLFDVPPLFQLIQAESNTDWHEMYQVFNMGNRLEIYTSAEKAQAMIDIANNFGIEARVIGYVEAAETNSVEVQTPLGHFSYQ